MAKEYDFLNKILNSEFLYSSQGRSELGDTQSSQKVTVANKGVDYKIYKFDEQIGKVLPFFQSGSNNEVPKNLLAFCDFIIIAEKTCKNDKVHILLVELKLSRQNHAPDQLDASEEFVTYIINSAQRVGKNFKNGNFDKGKVKIRRIIVISNLKNTQKDTTDYTQKEICIKGPVLPLRKIIGN